MRHRNIALILSAGLFMATWVGAGETLLAGAVGKSDTKATTKTKPSAQLKKEWGLDDLKVTKKAVQGASFPQDIRKSAIEAIDSYLSQQEKLLDEADGAKDNGAAAKKSRAALESEFQKKMKTIYGNPEYKAELDKRIKAMKAEMDDNATKAAGMFEELNKPKTQPSGKTAKSTTTKSSK